MAVHRTGASRALRPQGRVPLRIAANSRPTQRIRKTQRSRTYCLGMRLVDTKCTIKSQKCSDCQRHHRAQTTRVHRVLTWLVGRSMNTVAKNGTLSIRQQGPSMAPLGSLHISAPKGGLAAEHRRNTAFSHILTVTWRDAGVNIQTTSGSIRGAGTQCGPSHPRMG